MAKKSKKIAKKSIPPKGSMAKKSKKIVKNDIPPKGSKKIVKNYIQNYFPPAETEPITNNNADLLKNKDEAEVWCDVMAAR